MSALEKNEAGKRVENAEGTSLKIMVREGFSEVSTFAQEIEPVME